MKKLIGILAFLCCYTVLSAQIIPPSGAIFLDKPKMLDYVLIFKDIKQDNTITFNTEVQEMYELHDGDSTLLAYTGFKDWNMAEDGTGYIVHTIDGDRITFWVIDYASHRIKLDDIQVEHDEDTWCQETRLKIVGDIPELSYQTQYGSKQTIKREGELSYYTQAWNGESWTDSLVVKETELKRQITINDAPLCATKFVLRADNWLQELGLEQDSIESDMFDAVAVAQHYTTQTTIRGESNENESNRPIDDTMLSGSAPLEIFFSANPSSAGHYFNWQIFKGSDLITTRTDAQHRYTFDDSGEYKVKLVVKGDHCETDTAEIDISVSSSKLFVPNVFTPNGDGSNDEFRVAYESIVEFDCWVYNRWGKLVYHWNDPAKGWDGTINGKPAAEGAYYYVIRAKGADAEGNGYKSKAKFKKDRPIGIYQLSGDINLLR